MIIRSDCRGDPRNTSAPKRAISKRETDIDIISMAQQASPNDIGQMEFFRAQLIALPSVVVNSAFRNETFLESGVVDEREQITHSRTNFAFYRFREASQLTTTVMDVEAELSGAVETL